MAIIYVDPSKRPPKEKRQYMTAKDLADLERQGQVLKLSVYAVSTAVILLVLFIMVRSIIH
jgi:type III secretory pathway component EscU